MKIKNHNEVTHLNLNSITSNDSLRPVMQGVFVDFVNSCFVATNSHVLMTWKFSIVDEYGNLEYDTNNEDLEKASKIVPTELFNKNKWMGNAKKYLVDPIFDFSDENFAKVFIGDILVYQCNYIDGNFPNYKAVIPKESHELNRIAINLNMMNLLYKSIPFSNKNLIFEFSAPNRSIVVETDNKECKGVIMPIVGI